MVAAVPLNSELSTVVADVAANSNVRGQAIEINGLGLIGLVVDTSMIENLVIGDAETRRSMPSIVHIHRAHIDHVTIDVDREVAIFHIVTHVGVARSRLDSDSATFEILQQIMAEGVATTTVKEIYR